MFIETLGTLLAGIGLFFTGLALLHKSVKRLSNYLIDTVLIKHQKEHFVAPLIGMIVALLGHAPSTIALLCASLVAVNAIAVSVALSVVTWVTVANTLMLLIFLSNIKLMASFFLGVTGIAFAITRFTQRRYIIRTLFSIALILFGVSLTIEAGDGLDLLLTDRSDTVAYPGILSLAFFTGAVVAYFFRTSIALLFLTITLGHLGLITLAEGTLIICGIYVGAGLSLLPQVSTFEGRARQVALYHVIYRCSIGIVIIAALITCKLSTGESLFLLISDYFEEIHVQLAVIAFSLALIPAVIITPFLGYIERYFQEKQEFKTYELPSADHLFHHSGDLETIMLLVKKIHVRQLEKLPSYVDRLRLNPDQKSTFNLERTHEKFACASSKLRLFLEQYTHQHLSEDAYSLLSELMQRQSILESIESSFYTLGSLHIATGFSQELDTLTNNLSEALETIALSALDAIRLSDKEEIETLLKITEPKSEHMNQVREQYLSDEIALDMQTRAHLLSLINLFEQSCWLFRSLGKVLKVTPQ